MRLQSVQTAAFWRHILILLVLAIGLSACASEPHDRLMLMPAPDVFDQGDWDPFTDRDPIADIPYGGILYATDRKPARKEGQYYQDDRGHVLRLGVAQITAGEEGMTWEEARRISLLKERPQDYPLKVTGVQEVGVLDSSINVFTEDLVGTGPERPTDEKFAAKVNAKLAISQRKDVYIYVHGYKVVFENPLLVASELWHFLLLGSGNGSAIGREFAAAHPIPGRKYRCPANPPHRLQRRYAIGDGCAVSIGIDECRRERNRFGQR